jgi:putative polyhydroxyalkanoate system protein
MRVTVNHNTTKSEARQIVEKRLDELQRQYGHYANDVQKDWQGDRLDFEVKARGFTGKGTVEITDSEVIIDGKLPLIAKPFESRIKSTLEQEATDMFRKA